MDTLLQIGLSNAVVAALLALVVAGIGLCCRRPALLHSLWLLVFLKLLTPPLVWIPVEWPSLAAPVAEVAPAPPAVEPTSRADAEPTPAFVFDLPAAGGNPPAALEENEPVTGFTVVSAPEETTTTAAPPPAEKPAFPWLSWWRPAVLAVWLTGSALWFACALRRLVLFQRLLRNARLAPIQLQKQTERLARKLGMTSAPTVYLVPGCLSPLLWALFGSARLVLPAALLGHVTDEQRNTLILHELAHLRRRDHWVRGLEFLVMGLFWWHPVVWYVRRELREAEEQCCDAWVVSALPEANKTYATALVETIEFLSAVRSPVPLLASGVGHITDLKRRLTLIMHGTTPRTLSWRGMLLVCGLAAFLLPVLPVFAQDKADKKPVDGIIVERYFELLNRAEAAADTEKAQAELAEIQAHVEQKHKEIHDIEAKISALRQKLARAEGKAADGSESARAAYRFLIQSQKGGEPQEILLRKVGNKWEIVDPKDAKADDIRMMAPIRLRLEGVDAGNAARYVPLQDGTIFKKSVPPAPPPTKAGRDDPDRRLDELEMKLEKILQQLEQMQERLK